jgi:signal transduction histidine kinase
MKLISQYNRISLLATILVCLLASLAFYFLLQFVLIEQLDESLRIEQQEIASYVAKYNKLPEIIPVHDQQISYRHVENQIGEAFSTIQAADAGDKEVEPFRQFIFSMPVQQQWYEVRVRKSLEETDGIIRSIIFITVITILLILVSTMFINRVVLGNLWRPFYKTLDTMAHFKLGQQEPVHFPATAIDEFELMNDMLKKVSGKAQQDYLLLKEWTENAAHELQTPLAIIRSQLDALVQDENLTEQQSKAIQCADGSLERLSRLNRSLLLLAKIDNQQFADIAPVGLTGKLEEKLVQFRELWQEKELTITTSLQPATPMMNNELADVLLNNLLGNAFRHSNVGGSLAILLNDQLLQLCNTGRREALQQEQLFTRFYKPVSASGSNGLGLSLIKQICDVSGYRIQYQYLEERHVFTLLFAPAGQFPELPLL